MDSPAIVNVIRDVFGANHPTEVSSGWVRMPCPLAPWTHNSHRDRKPSAGVSVKPNGTSIFNCFTCGNKTPLHGLLRKYADFTGENLDDLIEELTEESYLGPRELPDWSSVRGAKTAPPIVPLDTHMFLDLYDRAAGHPYLQERGISDATAELLQLRVDPSDPVDGEERILFPVFGFDGGLYGFAGRATREGARIKARDYHGLPKARALLGAHLFREPRPYMLLVEGLFDYANAWECGFPAAAVMHSTLTDEQAVIARQIAVPTYLFYDNDPPGQKGAEHAGRLLRGYQPVMRVRYPSVVVPANDGGDARPLKDPGEMVADEFQWMIDDARLY